MSIYIVQTERGTQFSESPGEDYIAGPFNSRSDANEFLRARHRDKVNGLLSAVFVLGGIFVLIAMALSDFGVR